MPVAHELKGLDAVRARDDLVPGALEAHADEREDVDVVVGDEYETRGHVPRIGPLPAQPIHGPSYLRQPGSRAFSPKRVRA